MSKKVNKQVTEVKVLTKTEMIAEYRKLGKDMTELRENHLKEIEALIVDYKSKKAAIKAERAKLLEKIRAPKVEEHKVDETKAAA